MLPTNLSALVAMQHETVAPLVYMRMQTRATVSLRHVRFTGPMPNAPTVSRDVDSYPVVKDRAGIVGSTDFPCISSPFRLWIQLTVPGQSQGKPRQHPPNVKRDAPWFLNYPPPDPPPPLVGGAGLGSRVVGPVGAFGPGGAGWVAGAAG